MMVPLESLRISDRSRFGSKAVRLGELVRAGLNVPKGYTISREECSEWLSDIGLSLETPGAVSAESLAGISGLPRTVKGQIRKIESEPSVLDPPSILVIPDNRAVRSRSC